MDAATLILTLTLAGKSHERVFEHPSVADCERAGRDAISIAPEGWTVQFRCFPNIRTDTNLHAPATESK